MKMMRNLNYYKFVIIICCTFTMIVTETYLILPKYLASFHTTGVLKGHQMSSFQDLLVFIFQNSIITNYFGF